MRVSSSPLHFACHLAALATSVNAQTAADSQVAEIDLIIPLPNTTYQAGESDRFPMVWAVRNPNQWQSGSAELAYSVKPNEAGSLSSSGTLSLNNLTSSPDAQAYYLTANIIGERDNDFKVSWYVSGAKCDSKNGFGHGGDASPVSAFTFSVAKAGGQGQKADFSTAAAAGNCKSRTAQAYKYSIDTNDACRVFDDEDPYPEPDPCGLKVADSAAATVQKSLDDQLKQLCDDRPNSHICPLPKTATSTNTTSTDKKNAAAAAQVDAGTLLLGLGLSILAVRGAFLS